MDLEEAGAPVVDRFGPGTETWLAEVPALAARLASRWGVVLGELFASGASSLVLRCRWRDGTPAVLKLSPDRARVGAQAEMLRVFAPSGRVPAVLAVDAEAGAMVLEEIRAGTEAGDRPAEALPPRWAALLAARPAPPPPPH